MSKNYKVVFTAQKKVELQECEMPVVGDDDILLKTEVSQISTGTELTLLEGNVEPDSPWMNDIHYPQDPGYSNVGKIVKVGKNVSSDLIGKRMLTLATHTMYYTINKDDYQQTMFIPDSVKSEEAVFQVTFKTKTGVSGKTGDISYSSILASNSQQDIFATDISTTITIGNVPVGNTTNTTNTQSIVPILPSNTVKNTTANNVANSIVVNRVGNTSVNTANRVSNSTYTNRTANNVTEEIPYTGTEDTVMYIMIVALALALIFYIKFQKKIYKIKKTANYSFRVWSLL